MKEYKCLAELFDEGVDAESAAAVLVLAAAHIIVHFPFNKERFWDVLALLENNDERRAKLISTLKDVLN